MPKQVDHQARRRSISEALWRVAVRHGLEGVSLRHVATEAGVSMGMIQHYFATKDQMLLFALATLNDRVTQRVGERIAGLSDPAVPRALVRSVLLELLPLDGERRDDCIVGFAFLAQASVRPTIASAFRGSFAQLQDFVSGQIRRSLEVGQSRSDLDPEREAATLLALIDGLAAHTVVGLCPAETILPHLDCYLDRLFPTPVRQDDANRD